ncbi:MAG: AAA family ATPase [Planctomycetota bacterium]|nr:AAA family ATPase [Planctomycetota bacterium]
MSDQVSVESLKSPEGQAAVEDPALVPEVPAWYPDWARELASMYFSGSICMFVLHGNVHDLVRCPAAGDDDNGPDRFVSLAEFLSSQVFGNWDVVVSYDLGRGMRPQAGRDSGRLQEMVRHISSVIGNPAGWPRDPDKVLSALETIIQRNLLQEDPNERKRMGFMFEHAQYLIPAGDLNMLARGQASRLVRLMSWAQNPYIKRQNIAFCLVADKLTEVNDRLVQNPHVAAIEIPLPDLDQRHRFIETNVAENGANLKDLTPDSMAQLASGLNLVSLNVVLSRSSSNRPLETRQFRALKKNLIERQCRGLVTFVQPEHNLDMVVGHKVAKARLRQDGAWLGEGRLDTAPMGYLICGPVGTGKTFMAECYAGSIGIPCVTLRNFRSKYVGETEGNLEQVLTVLRSLGPVLVIIDEADAALGSREMEGDSGTSGRVFSMIASQMGNTKYRGRIIWMLLTSRPDLLPIDIKRQGRAEVHVPLFYPQEVEEIADMFRVMARKNKTNLADDAVPEVSPERNLSGADIESVVLSARRRALADGRDVIERTDLEASLHSFIPSAQGLEKEMQELAAVLECTDREFLPSRWQEKMDEPNGRTRIQERCVAIRQLLEQL